MNIRDEIKGYLNNGRYLKTGNQISKNWSTEYLIIKDAEENEVEWKCEKVFLYIGVDEGDLDTTNMVEILKKNDCIVRDQTVFAYKNRDKELDIACPSCGNKFIEKINMGYNRKSNCDVDLTVDAMDLAGPDSEFYIFTGDGDFSSLIRNAISKGTKIFIVSSAKKIKSGPRYFTSRYSTRLRRLFNEFSGKLSFIEINNLKLKIEKTK